MSKYERQTYRAIMATIALTGVVLCAEGVLRETECCPKGGQFAGGLTMLIMAYMGWPSKPYAP